MATAEAGTDKLKKLTALPTISMTAFWDWREPQAVLSTETPCASTDGSISLN